VTVLGTRVDGDVATVWLLTNDGPQFEPYEVTCERCDDGSWEPSSVSGGFSVDTPAEVLAKAKALGA